MPTVWSMVKHTGEPNLIDSAIIRRSIKACDWHLIDKPRAPWWNNGGEIGWDLFGLASQAVVHPFCFW